MQDKDKCVTDQWGLQAQMLKAYLLLPRAW